MEGSNIWIEYPVFVRRISYVIGSSLQFTTKPGPGLVRLFVVREVRQGIQNAPSPGILLSAIGGLQM